MEHKKTIFVTGISGFVGKNFLEYARKEKKDFQILALVHKKDIPLAPPIVEKIKGDVCDINSLEKVFLSQKIDGILHLAAVIKSKNLSDYEKVNVQGTRNLVQLAEKYGVKKFIFLSSDFVLYEKFAPNPYGISKRKCEEIIKNSNLDYTIFRPTPIFGPGDNKNFVTLASFVKKFPIIPAIHCYMEPVFVGDVCQAICCALETEKANRKIYYLPGGKGYDFVEILKIVAKIQNLKRLILPLPPFLFLPALFLFEKIYKNSPLETYQVKKWLKTKPLDATETKKDLNYQPTTFEEKVFTIFQ
ncbi:NAD(P)-dependent oxidoreductase [Candidatus Parcubacteria bacterium]|nr:NAD(P)-dependent oxidoreductase [Candidatus Parcubacteria bacterium]